MLHKWPPPLLFRASRMNLVVTPWTNAGLNDLGGPPMFYQTPDRAQQSEITVIPTFVTHWSDANSLGL